MSKRIAITVIIGILLTFSINAATVSFYVIEAGMNDEADSKISGLWETAFMDVFFDAGYIISNAPVLRLDRSPSNIFPLLDFKEAGACGIDYMLVVLLDYNKDFPSPEEASFYIYKVKKQEKVVERKVRLKPIKVTSREDYNNMKSIARGFIPYIGE
jgi:hypothetical protein